MYLKSLEIQGFKSFANKILFKFHNGITGIVGPNGSGKSNVGDAVRWVLGEQSSRQLRGTSMQDVIFSGTESRRPLGYASVSITLDNSDHQLPIDYEEVTVTRRVYRSGESEYLMNGTVCRLRDINELFYDTGIGKEGYSIVGQGQIDKILSGKPEDRRELFDEAAGIVKFKRRKLTAQKKLEIEQHNLVRVNDILAELARQLAPLERQAETARIYLNKRDELKQYDINLFLLDMERLKEQLETVEKHLEIVQNQLSEVREQFENTKVKYDRSQSEIEQIEEMLDRTREMANQSRLLQQQMTGQEELLREQIRTEQMNEQHLQERSEAIGKEISARREMKEKECSSLSILKEQLVRVEQEEEDSRLEADASQAVISHLDGQIEDGKNAIIELLNQRASVKGRLQRYDTMDEQMQIRRAEVCSLLLKLGSEASEQEEEIERRKSALDEVSAEIEKYLGESKSHEEKVNKLSELIMEQSRKVEQGQAAYHREASRLESLVNITERYDGYGNSIRRIMEQRKNEPGIRGVVADLIQVEKSYETAIETALGGSIQNIVTDDEDTAKRMIAFLKKNKYGRATFLPLTAVGKKNRQDNEEVLAEPGIIGRADSLVHTGERYRNLISYLLGRTFVADNIDTAIAVARKYRYSLRIVTLEGESLSPGGSMTGGAFKNNSNLLGRRREIEELKASVQMLKDELEKTRQELDRARDQRSALRQEIVNLNERLQKEYLRQNTERMNIRQMESRRAEAKERMKKLQAELLEIDGQVLQIGQDKEAISVELVGSQKEEQEILKKIEGWQQEQETEKTAFEAQNARTEKLHLELAQVRQRKEFITQTLSRIEGELAAFLEEKQSVEKKARESAENVKQKREQIEDILAAAEKEKVSEEELRKKLAELAGQKEEKTAGQKQFFDEREELSARISALDKENFRLEAQKEKCQERREEQINYIWNEYNLTPSETEKLRSAEAGDYGAMKKQASRLRTEIKELGNVNVNAIEDYKELSERHAFLTGQREDLTQAKLALEKIITELDAGMCAQFEEKFALIRMEFDKAFKELFGGGKGTLELVEDEDVLEAGIRIIAQPPGKKLQNMMQLSGGEKALTAIALLFAIQQLKPSPFCLLDEIEAALDESNVGRYARYLHKLTKNTQFIIITHRRGTMAAADRLYGITMQEKGVSALVSVNLIEEELDK